MRLSSIKRVLREHGLALVVIIVGWEVIEDIMFPVLFIWLGTHLHPIFLVGAPASWLMCFHWLTVPILWGAWMRWKGRHSESR